MSRAVLEVVVEEDLLLSSLHHGTPFCGELCRGIHLQYTYLYAIHCLGYKSLVCLIQLKVAVVLLGIDMHSGKSLAKYSVWTMIHSGKSSLAGRQLFCVPHWPLGGTRKEMSCPSYVSYLLELKRGLMSCASCKLQLQ